MRVPTFSLRRHSDFLEELISFAESDPTGSREGFSVSFPLFLPSTISRRALESFFRCIFGTGRSAFIHYMSFNDVELHYSLTDGSQGDHTATIEDLINTLKLSRYLMSRGCYFEAVDKLDSIQVGRDQAFALETHPLHCHAAHQWEPASTPL